MKRNLTVEILVILLLTVVITSLAGMDTSFVVGIVFMFIWIFLLVIGFIDTLKLLPKKTVFENDEIIKIPLGEEIRY